MNKELVRKEYENMTLGELCNTYINSYKDKNKFYNNMIHLSANDHKDREDLFLDWGQVNAIDGYYQGMWRCEILGELIWAMIETLGIKASIQIVNNANMKITILPKEKKITITL